MTNKVETKLQDEKDTKRNLHKVEDDEEYDYITIPPDGGYGWVVLLACFMINLIVDGFLYAFGAISETLRKHFDCHEWEVTLVSSLACGFYLLSAPIASALCNKYGCRKVGIIGSVIGALAVAASVLAPNIYIMWLLFGVIGGIGMGLVYLPSIIMVGYYFEEKRAIATGIVTAGTGIGSIIFGPMSRILFDIFGWKTGVLILSAILLCCVICCIFMRPLQPIQKRRVLPSSDLVDDNVFNGTTSSPLINETKPIRTGNIPTSIQTPDSNFSEVTIEQKIKKRSRTDSAISTKSRQSIKAEDAVRPLYKEDVLYQGDTNDLPEYTSQPDIATYIQQTTKVPETVEKTKMKAFWDIFLSMADFNLLTDKKMLIICLANVCSMIGFYSPYLFIPKLAELERSIPEASAVFLLSIIGFSNTAARFASGWITKIPHMTPLLVNNIGLTIAGIASLLVPLCQTHIHLIIYCIIWGGFIAFHVSLSPVIVCQTVGLERYSNALGLTLMFRGITALSAPPIMGAIRDATNSFDIAFIIGGISFIVSALMHFFLMWVNRREEEQLNKTKKINNIQIKSGALDV
ncbi:unnamed protein product [Adineta steineri]|uniref:Major facilitator superfamily (MFS) profile domain-containing protein n=1 Tax=Adineta steineri TaxID=433720 RepID=A0A815SWR3_9BILA|nr:unnamed protein product [Adineta steineri]CAF1499371.1 unnamed protein product [Adineta steineri]